MEIIAVLIGLAKTLFDFFKGLFDWRKKRMASEHRQKREKDAVIILERFLSIFEIREVPRSLIPRFLAAQHLITVQEACSDSLLAYKLNDALIAHTAKRLAISSAWLYGMDTSPEVHPSNYKNPNGVLSLLEQLLSQQTSSYEELVVVANENCADNVPVETRTVVLLSQTIDQVEGIDVEQHHIIESDLPWSHDPARLHCKHIVLLAMTLGIPIRGTSVPAATFLQFERGDLQAQQILLAGTGIWHPDDYVVTSNKSFVAKEQAEAITARDELLKLKLIEKASASRHRLNKDDVYGSLFPNVTDHKNLGSMESSS